MSDTLTIIVSVLVPTIGTQIGFMFFIFRRMDRMEERLTRRMDRADDGRMQIRAEFSEDSEKTRATFRDDLEKTRLEFKGDSEMTRTEFRTEMQEIRTEFTAARTSLARLEGAVEVLRSLAERIAPAPR